MKKTHSDIGRSIFADDSIKDLFMDDYNGVVNSPRPYYVNFFAEINRETSDKFVDIITEQKRIYLFNKIKNNMEIPIKIYFNTSGGSISDGFNIIDSLNDLVKNGIVFSLITKGFVFSLGLIILLSFRNFVEVQPRTIFGTTEIKGKYYGNVPKKMPSSEFSNVLADKLRDYMADVLKVPCAKVAEFLEFEKSYNTFDDIQKFLEI